MDNQSYKPPINDGMRTISPIYQTIPSHLMIFTSRLMHEKGKRDFTTYRFSEHTGYIRTDRKYYSGPLIENELYRLIVVAGPFKYTHEKGRFHQHFLAVPFRDLFNVEGEDMNILSQEDFVYLNRVILERLTEPVFSSDVLRNDFLYMKKLNRRVLIR